MDARLLEVLCCNGCIMGAGMSSDAAAVRAARPRQRVRPRPPPARRPPRRPGRRRRSLDGLDLSRGFAPNDQRIPVPSPEEMTSILARMGKLKPEDELNCGACGYDTCREHAIAIHQRPGRERDVPAVHHRPAPQDGQGTRRLERAAASTQEALMHIGEARQHGPARRRHRARGEQPARRRPDVRAPAAERRATTPSSART